MMSVKLILVLCFIQLVFAKKSVKNFQDQFCIDPRTQEKHAAYSEWSDAYSCTRHRCQPSGRNLAIYTVGCKKVEPPESAIECEEVVEDTNMQFPYCCSRLRCLVVVRGEVWTKVLGQPWETLPAAPWSHMYKMKKPAPGHKDVGIHYNEPEVVQNDIKNDENTKPLDGPVYELGDTVKETEPEEHEEAPKQTKKKTKGKFKSDVQKTDNNVFAQQQDSLEEKSIDAIHMDNEIEISDEKENLSTDTQVLNEMEQVTNNKEEPQYKPTTASKPPATKKSKLQELVDAIGNRMRDIENVVHKMREKVYVNNMNRDDSGEKDTRGSEKNYPRPTNFNKRNIIKKSNIMKSEMDEAKNSDGPEFIQEPNDLSAIDSRTRNMISIPKEPQKSIYMAPVTSKRRHRKGRMDPRKHIKNNKRKSSKKRASLEFLDSEIESSSKE